jgi:hypothetical protein
MIDMHPRLRKLLARSKRSAMTDFTREDAEELRDLLREYDRLYRVSQEPLDRAIALTSCVRELARVKQLARRLLRIPNRELRPSVAKKIAREIRRPLP